MHGAQPDNPTAPLRTSLVRAGLALVVIACGLSLRWYGFPLGLPAFVVKYGGSLLWATMVFLLVGVLLPRLSRMQLAAIAVLIAVVVEFSRLVHGPWLDAFRLTTAGALLLGASSRCGILSPTSSALSSASGSTAASRETGSPSQTRSIRNRPRRPANDQLRRHGETTVALDAAHPLQQHGRGMAAHRRQIPRNRRDRRRVQFGEIRVAAGHHRNPVPHETRTNSERGPRQGNDDAHSAS